MVSAILKEELWPKVQGKVPPDTHTHFTRAIKEGSDNDYTQNPTQGYSSLYLLPPFPHFRVHCGKWAYFYNKRRI